MSFKQPEVGGVRLLETKWVNFATIIRDNTVLDIHEIAGQNKNSGTNEPSDK